MLRNLIDGSQNAVWRLALKGKIPQNYENRSKLSVFLDTGNVEVGEERRGTLCDA